MRDRKEELSRQRCNSSYLGTDRLDYSPAPRPGAKEVRLSFGPDSYLSRFASFAKLVIGNQPVGM